MQTQTFQAREIKEALALVRRELGADAIVVGTRRIPGRAMGLLGGTLIEVTARPAPDEPTKPAGVKRPPPEPEPQAELEEEKKAPDTPARKSREKSDPSQLELF